MQPPRFRAPPAPAAPKLKLSKLRSSESAALDRRPIRLPRGETATPPPYVSWPDFQRYFKQAWKVGPPDWPNANVALVGSAGSGKTTLAREILRHRDYVCVFGSKTRDASLYDPLGRQGYKLVDRWNPDDTRQPKVIFRPPLAAPTVEALRAQREAFRGALLRVFQTGGWTLYFDEVRYLSQTLKLANELDLLWLQGRSLGIVIVAGTQRPVSVPLNMFEQSRFSFLWRITGAEDRRTVAAYTGQSAPVVAEVAAILPPHETLYVDSEQDVLMRTTVAR